MQTSYSINNAKAVAGQPWGNWLDMFIDSHFVAGEDLEPGRVAVLNGSNKLVHPQSTGFTDPIMGVVVFSPTNEQPGIPAAGFVYKAGVMVPVMRKGRIVTAAEAAADPTVSFTALNVEHSSTTATNRGKVTTRATSTTAGAEIAAASGLAFVEVITALTLYVVELNLPQ